MTDPINNNTVRVITLWTPGSGPEISGPRYTHKVFNAPRWYGLKRNVIVEIGRRYFAYRRRYFGGGICCCRHRCRGRRRFRRRTIPDNFQFASHYLGGIPILAGFVLPFAGAVLPFDINPRTLSEVLGDYFGEVAEEDHPVPFGAFLLLAGLLIFPPFGSGDIHVGDGFAILGIANFRVRAEVAENEGFLHFLVPYIGCFRFLFLGLAYRLTVGIYSTRTEKIVNHFFAFGRKKFIFLSNLLNLLMGRGVFGYNKDINLYKNEDSHMATPLTIATLRDHPVKPTAWQVIQHMDGVFTLKFTYGNPSRREDWGDILSRRGDVRRYKTSDAVLKDISRVQTEALIHAFLIEEKSELSAK
jgi:hypothetical protein